VPAQDLAELDHVLLAVPDLAAAARTLEREHGVTAIEGGRHPGWGTANRIVPLGDTYLELVAVVDESEAARSSFGRWVAASQSEELRPFGWAVRTRQLADIANRLDLTAKEGSRTGRDGRLVSWRMVGVEEAAAEPALPFFIEWAPGTVLPGLACVVHPAGDVGITRVRLSGDREQISLWLGAHRAPIETHRGTSAINAVILRGASGDQTVLGSA
jgi:hypothetical protein